MTIPIKTFCQTGSGTTKPPDDSRTVGKRNIPPMVIVPDQTPDYPQLTASAVWRHSFRGLHKNKNLTLLGLAPQSTKQARYTFGPISALRPGYVLRSLPTLPTL